METNTRPSAFFSNSANGLETANIAVKVSEGLLYLVHHEVISDPTGAGLARFRGGTRRPFAFNRLRLASV